MWLGGTFNALSGGRNFNTFIDETNPNSGELDTNLDIQNAFFANSSFFNGTLGVINVNGMYFRPPGNPFEDYLSPTSF